MKILITGGNTSIPIDQVRTISNVFKGRTAVDICNYISRDHECTLIGNSGMEDGINYTSKIDDFIEYKTYDQLHDAMKSEIQGEKYGEKYDCIIHSAAVSDYYVSGVLDENYQKIDNSKKVSSNYSKMYLELSPTKKIIDEIRGWGFDGILVKFKLQVGISDEELIKIAQKSRRDSNADIIVANCLEWAKEKAFILSKDSIRLVKRHSLAQSLIKEIEHIKQLKSNE